MGTRVSDHIRRNVYGILALFVALSAGAYATTTAPKNSVTSKSIKTGAVQSSDVKDNGLTGTDINESTLQGTIGAQGPQGPQGPLGPQGPTGPAGASGSPDTAAQVLAKLLTVDGSGSSLDADQLDGIGSSDFVQDADTVGGGDLAGTYSSPTIAGNAVALGADTTGDYVGTVATPANNGLTGGLAGSEGTAISLGLDYSATLASNGLAANRSSFASTGVIFEGTTADAIETLLTVADPTTIDKTITLPNAAGTVQLSNEPASFTTLSVGGGATITEHLSGTASIDFGSVPANGCITGTITVTGAAVGDTVALGVPHDSTVASVAYSAWVSTANTVTVQACNVATNASADPFIGTFRADVWGH